MDQETVSTICYLARLQIEKNKSEKIKQDLETIIDLIDGLQKIDTSSIDPLYSPLEMTALNMKTSKSQIIKKINFLKIRLYQMKTISLSRELLNEYTIQIYFRA